MENDLRNPTAEHGFEWVIEPVSKQAGPNKSDRKIVGKGPILRVTDVAKFDATFPGVILACLDGSSIRVKAQGVVRPMLIANPNVSIDDMKDAVINNLKGVRSARRAAAPVFVGLDGKNYATQTEAAQANLAHLVDSGIPADVARQVLGL